MKQFWKRAAVAIVSLALLAGMPPAAGAASDEVEAALASMTLREKVGQLFAVRPEALDFEQRSGGMKLTCSMREHLRSYPVGGIVLFATNISSQSQMTALIRDFQRSAGNSLLVAVDEEGGPVARLANSSAFDLPKFPSASAIGTTGDPEQARTMGRTIRRLPEALRLQSGPCPRRRCQLQPPEPGHRPPRLFLRPGRHRRDGPCYGAGLP